MNREGVARWPALLELPKRSPRPALLPTVGLPRHSHCLSAVCCSAATASPPVRATLSQCTASQGRAGGRAGRRGRARRSEAESLDRCATLGQPHGGSVVKGSKGVDF